MLCFSNGALPPAVCPRYAEDILRSVVQRLRERNEMLKVKVIDPYATSPEVTPPVSKCGRKRHRRSKLKHRGDGNPPHPFVSSAPLLTREDYIRMKEEEQRAKEEEDRRRAEEAARKAEEKKKKDEEKRLEAERKAEEERLAEEVRRKARILPEISCSCFDLLLQPVEEKMDAVLGSTIDPFTGGPSSGWI